MSALRDGSWRWLRSSCREAGLLVCSDAMVLMFRSQAQASSWYERINDMDFVYDRIEILRTIFVDHSDICFAV